jgi:3-hydroxyacyl-CoA dehydrogenase
MQVGLKQGKTPIFVKDVPGFFVNRCLTPVLREAMALVEEGVNIEKIDKAMKAFGMPVGPIALSGTAHRTVL